LVQADGTVKLVGGGAWAPISNGLVNQAELHDAIEVVPSGFGMAVRRFGAETITWGHNPFGNSFSTTQAQDHRWITASNNGFASANWGTGVSTGGYLGTASAFSSSPQTSAIRSIAASGDAFAAITLGNAVEAWGDPLSGGSLSGATGSLSGGVREITSTPRSFAAIKADGTVVTWGDPNYGGQIDAATQNLINQ
jgi:hypothetical protein